MANEEKLIFPIGFDLEEGAKQVEKDWEGVQKRLQNTFKAQTIHIDADISKSVLDKLYSKFEGLIKSMESKAPQIKLKIPDTVDFEQEINRLKVQLRSINLGELTDAESKDLYLYIRQLEALAKALKEVNKQEQLRQANNPENKALKQAQAEEKLTRSLANSALAEQRRAKIATESARQSEINTRATQREAIMAEQKRAAIARAEQAELRLEQAKQRSTRATHAQNAAYKTQSSYLQRLAQRMVAYASIAQARSFVRNVRDVTMEFELQRVALGSIIGDLNRANALFEQIKAAAVKSPFQIKELVSYTKQLSAYKIETDQLFETTQRLADISAGLGVGMERLVLAYGQIRATGYLRASEVRQLTEAGIPIIEELAKKMSQLRGETISAAEVMGMISERAVSFGMVKEVFDDMTSAGGMFYKMQEKQAETLAGQWSNLKDSISIMYDEIGRTDKANNVIKGSIGIVKSLAENWRTVGAVISTVTAGFVAYKAAMISASVASKALTASEAKLAALEMTREARMPRLIKMFLTQNAQIKVTIALNKALVFAQKKALMATNALSAGFWKLATAMLSNPYTAIIAAVAALSTYLLTAKSSAEKLQEELNKIGTEGALQSNQQVRNFERLAIAIRENVKGSSKQTQALAEMKRAYGEFLPSQDESIINLVREKEGYEAITQAIREKIAMQMQEQKISTITSEYGSQFTKWEGNIATDELFKRFSKEEISLIVADIKNAINEGLISTANEAEDNAKKIQEIIKNITGKEVRYDAVIARLQGGLLGYGRALGKLVETQENYNSQIQNVENSMESATGSLGKYTQAYKDLKEELKDVTGTGEKFSFEWNESKTKAEIKAYNKFIGNLLAKEDIKFDIGESIDFEKLYKTIGDQHPQLKQAIAKIQKEYEKLVPKDLEKLINNQFVKLANNAGASLDKLQHYFKDSDTATQDWVKTLKEGVKNIDNKIFDAKKLGEDTKELEAQKSVLEAMIKEWDNSKGAGKSQLTILQEELSMHEKIYAKYKEYRKYMSAEQAKSKINEEFADTISAMSIKPKLDDKGIGFKQVLEDIKKKVQALPNSEKVAMEIGFKIDNVDWENTKSNIEKNLAKLSSDLSRTKTAKDFFDRMLGLTGDKQLSATLTMSVYGMEADKLEGNMFQTLRDQAETLFQGVDIASAFNEETKKIDYTKLDTFVEQLPETMQKSARDFVDNGMKANDAWLSDLQKTYAKALTFDQQRTQVMEQEAQKRKEISESTMPEEQKEQYLQASKKREAERITAINLQEFKDSDDYLRIFEDIEHLSIPIIDRLIAKIREFINSNKELNATDLKNLTEQIQKLEEGKVRKDAWAGLISGIKDLNKYRKAIKNAKEGTKDYEDAIVGANKAHIKIQDSLGKLQNEFSQAQQLVDSFTQTLGISEDSDFGVFLNGISDALGGVSKALAFAQLAVQLFDGTIKSFLVSNPIGWILLIVSAIISAIQAIANAKVKRIDEEIEHIQGTLDNLEYSYERLEKAQEKAFGSDYINNYQQRLANLQAQMDAYQKQADLERSKGKKADEQKIKEYEEQVRDTANAIKDMQTEMSEHFLGTDLGSAAREFAQAWIEAYKEFGNTTDAMGKKFQEMIENMVVESFAAKIMQTALDPIFKEIDAMTKDGTLDMSDAAQVASLAQGAVANIDVGMSNLMSALEAAGISVRGMGSDLTGISRDIATASEESILGLAAGINTQNFYISQVPPKLDVIIGLLQGGNLAQGSAITLQDLVTIQNQHLSYLPSIAQHTAETVAECKQIVAETRRTADALERVIKPRGTQATHTLNATLN